MDHWLLKAEGEDEQGRKGVLTVRFREGDMDCTPSWEKGLMISMAARHHNVTITSAMMIDDDPDPNGDAPPTWVLS